MGPKQKDLLMGVSCLFFFLLSLAGLATVLLTGQVTGVDGLLLLMVCGGMLLLFAWLTFSALKTAGLVGRSPAEEPAADSSAQASPAPAARIEGK